MQVHLSRRSARREFAYWFRQARLERKQDFARSMRYLATALVWAGIVAEKI